MKKPGKVRSKMTPSLVSVRWNQPLAEAEKVMAEKEIRHLAVVGSQGELAGILSDRDLKRARDLERHDTWLEALVGDVMSWPVVTVDLKTPLVKALRMMIEDKISALLVTKGDAVVGIITSEDMLRAFHELLLSEETGKHLSVLDFTYDPVWRQVMQSVGSVGI